MAGPHTGAWVAGAAGLGRRARTPSARLGGDAGAPGDTRCSEASCVPVSFVALPSLEEDAVA